QESNPEWVICAGSLHNRCRLSAAHSRERPIVDRPNTRNPPVSGWRIRRLRLAREGSPQGVVRGSVICLPVPWGTSACPQIGGSAVPLSVRQLARHCSRIDGGDCGPAVPPPLKYFGARVVL